MTAMALEGGSGRRGGGGGWRTAAALVHHTRPVLSVAVTAVPLAATGGSGGGGAASHAVIACSGATDGAIAVWDLTAMSASHGAGGGVAAAAPMVLHPVGFIPASHQSGVNSIAVAPARGRTVRCRLTVSNPILKAPMVSALETKI